MNRFVLFYHQVVREAKPGRFLFRSSMTLDRFRTTMTWIKDRFHPLGMEEMAHGWSHGRRWPKRSVAITFDDGFKNSLLAARILHELKMSATFFVLSEVVDSDFLPWNIRFEHIVNQAPSGPIELPGGVVDFSSRLGKRKWLVATKERLLALSLEAQTEALDEMASVLGAGPIDTSDPECQYFSAADLRELCELGMTVGSHAATHSDLSRCDDRSLRRELVESRDRLGEWIGGPVDFLSYPDGRFNDKVLDLASRHYKLAFAAADHLSTDHAWRYPRRNAEPFTTRTLRPWFGLMSTVRRRSKRLLGI